MAQENKGLKALLGYLGPKELVEEFHHIDFAMNEFFLRIDFIYYKNGRFARIIRHGSSLLHLEMGDGEDFVRIRIQERDYRDIINYMRGEQNAHNGKRIETKF
jgi:hypothetical protein